MGEGCMMDVITGRTYVELDLNVAIWIATV